MDKKARKPFRRWALATVCIAVALLLLAGGIIVYVDPFFQYHLPVAGLNYPENELPRYENPGIARNSDYNGVMLGSSVTMNADMAWYQELLGLDVVALNMHAAEIYDLAKMGEVAFDSHNQIDAVFWCLELRIVEGDPHKGTEPLPEELYDNSVLNDMSYIFNKTVLLENALEVFIRTAREGAKQVEEVVLTTGEPEPEENLRYNEYLAVSNYANEHAWGEDTVYNAETAAANIQGNIEVNVLPLVKAHPDTQFFIFFPPASMLGWYYNITWQDPDVTIDGIEKAIATLLAYDNVQVYYFLNWEEVTTNLYHYRDSVHYDPSVNRYIAECFASGERRITQANLAGEMEKTRAMVHGFDFRLFWGNELIPFKTETDLYTWFSLTQAGRYIQLVSVGKPQPDPMGEMAVGYFQQIGLCAEDAYRPANVYAGVARGGNGVAEVFDSAPVVLQGEVEGLVYELNTSDGAPKVVIDGVDYSCGYGDTNVVIYDTELGRVVDSIGFYMYDIPVANRM